MQIDILQILQALSLKENQYFEYFNCIRSLKNIDRAMIRIPFDRCVILTTLDFAQVTDRLKSVIYDPNIPWQATNLNSLKHQPYFGQVRGFKFLATQIIGHKYLHLPIFLSPTIEGNINSLQSGYEISLAVRLNNVTFVLLLTWLGGLLTTVSSVLDNILVDAKNYQYLTTVQIAILCYLLVLAYLYFSAWSTTKFFRGLFAQGFTGTTKIGVVERPIWDSALQFQEVGDFPTGISQDRKSATDWLRHNLPSFPPHQTK